MTLNLEAIKARCERATAGPWNHDGRRSDYGAEFIWTEAEGDRKDPWIIGDDAPASVDDADFIAEARTDLPALVAEVERLRKVEAAARDMLNFGAHDGPCSHEEEGGECLLHVVTSKTRERALRAALDAAQGGG